MLKHFYCIWIVLQLSSGKHTDPFVIQNKHNIRTPNKTNTKLTLQETKLTTSYF